MEIEGRKLDINTNYLDPVTYIPKHAKGDANHPDAEQGVIISLRDDSVSVLYCTGRTVQATDPEDLVWG